MSDTKNELETLLEKAATEPAHRPAFFSALLEATVWVPGRAADGEQIVEDSALDLQHWEKDDGTSVIPFFTSLEALQQAVADEQAFVMMPARTLMAMTLGESLFLNPKLPSGKEFTPREISHLLGEEGSPLSTQTVLEGGEALLLLCLILPQGFLTAGSAPQIDALSALLLVAALTLLDEKRPLGGMLLYGASGLGKTFLLNCMAQRVLERGYSVVVISAYKLTETLRRYLFNGDGAEQVQDILTCDLLAIDDLGSEPMLRGVTLSAIYHIVNERNNANRAIVVTTNCSSDLLYEKYDDRIAARLTAPSKMSVIEFMGVDVRRYVR